MPFSELLSGAPPDAPALLAMGRPPLSYGRLNELVDTTVARLNQLGVRRHHRLASVVPNGPEAAAAFCALSAAATLAPLNPAYSQREFDFYLRDLRADALVAVPGFCEAALAAARALGLPLLALHPAPSAPAGLFTLDGSALGLGPGERGAAGPDHTALLLHSSGTTSRPKLIPLTHRNLQSSAANIARMLSLSPADRCLNVMPLFHIHGLVGAVLSSLAAGAAVSCSPGFNALAFFRWLEESSASWYTAVPAMHQMVLARAAEFPAQGRLRFLRSSSSHLHTKTWKELEERFGCPALNAYGMTEASHQVASNPLPPLRRQFGTVGTSRFTEYAILGPEGALLPAGAEGEVAIRGEAVTAGYLSPAEANSTAFAGPWFRTGDCGLVGADGYLTLTGRLKEIINCGGEKVSPAEVDEVLMSHPAVAVAVTFGVPCESLGEKVCAAVTLAAGHTVEEGDLRRFARDRLARFKVPRRVLIVSEIPKGPTGKLQRIGMARRLGL